MTIAPDLVQSDQALPTDIAPQIDAVKVERLRQAIATGEYTINEDQVAAKMVDQGFPEHD